MTWNTFFSDRRQRQLNDYPGPAADAPKRNNSDGRKRWWGMPGRSLAYVIDYIEGGARHRRRRPGCSAPAPPPTGGDDDDSDDSDVGDYTRFYRHFGM